jgi:hypothetical protein
VIVEQKASSIMLVLLIVLMIVYHVGRIVNLAVGLEPLPTVEFLYRFGFLCGVVWFLQSEARGSSVTRFYCPGVTFGVGWFFFVPYCLIKSRGVRGLIPLFALIATYFALQFLAIIVYVIFGGTGDLISPE